MQSVLYLEFCWTWQTVGCGVFPNLKYMYILKFRSVHQYRQIILDLKDKLSKLQDQNFNPGHAGSMYLNNIWTVLYVFAKLWMWVWGTEIHNKVHLHIFCMPVCGWYGSFSDESNAEYSNRISLWFLNMRWPVNTNKCSPDSSKLTNRVLLTVTTDIHTMQMLWEKFHWILPLYMKPINFQSKASVPCSVTTALFIDLCLKN